MHMVRTVATFILTEVCFIRLQQKIFLARLLNWMCQSHAHFVLLIPVKDLFSKKNLHDFFHLLLHYIRAGIQKCYTALKTILPSRIQHVVS